jgi:hypothetical protein
MRWLALSYHWRRNEEDILEWHNERGKIDLEHWVEKESSQEEIKTYVLPKHGWMGKYVAREEESDRYSSKRIELQKAPESLIIPWRRHSRIKRWWFLIYFLRVNISFSFEDVVLSWLKLANEQFVLWGLFLSVWRLRIWFIGLELRWLVIVWRRIWYFRFSSSSSWGAWFPFDWVFLRT